ncbi:HhH-GDP family DNA glycosylase [Tautonia plasticadhaerens]|uniref:Endonuclease III n=1 Tax=Tautonia plasticadhaerens TaxID=2527974 RepID=A0A518HAN7_9BACT|nr:endonuclease III [Tautonia plasticadhaerens]QDV37908.1 hypothetical protein ElP_58550 [Tautonia plasticadhaerens]
MPSFASDFDEIARALEASYGGPTPGVDAPSGSFRDLLRVFLVEQRGGQGGRVIEGLDRAGWSADPGALSGADAREVADALRVGGGAKVPEGLVAGVKRLAAWVVGRGGMEGVLAGATEALREELRAIRGVGAATADRLLRDALDRPAFPVGRADYRIMIRHGWIDPPADYDEARSVIEDAAPGGAEALRRLGSWFDRLARPCRVSAPQCDRCPLQPFLPEGGPLDPH